MSLTLLRIVSQVGSMQIWRQLVVKNNVRFRWMEVDVACASMVSTQRWPLTENADLSW